MIQVFAVAISVLFGGVSGVFIGRWLARGRANVTMTSIANGRHAVEVMEVPRRIVILSEDSCWIKPLDSSSSPKEIEITYRTAEKIRNFHPAAIKDAMAVLREISHAESRDERIELLGRILREPRIWQTVLLGLYSNKLAVATVEEIERDFTQEQLCEIVESQTSDGVALLVNLPQEIYTIPFEGPDWKLKHRASLPFFAAILCFHVDTIKKCLEYSKGQLEIDLVRAEAVIGSLDELFRADPFTIEASVVNNGERVTVLNPIALLQTKGGNRPIEPLPLRIYKVEEGSGNTFLVPRESTSYIPLEPQKIKKLYFISDHLESNIQLRSAFEGDTLTCSLAMLVQDGKAKNRRVTSTCRPFSSRITEQMKNEVLATLRG